MFSQTKIAHNFVLLPHIFRLMDTGNAFSSLLRILKNNNNNNNKKRQHTVLDHFLPYLEALLFCFVFLCIFIFMPLLLYKRIYMIN